MKTYDIRVEYPDGHHEDLRIGAEDIKQAIARCESMYSYLAPFDWHGQVVFVSGVRPAETVR